MNGWEDRSEEGRKRFLRYLAREDPWRATNWEIWPVLISAGLLMAQLPIGALEWLARQLKGK